MKPRASGRGEPLVRRLLPAGITLAFALLSAVPLDIPDYAAVTPSFLLMSLFHWTLYRPEHFSYLAAFAIGLLFDLLTTAPGATIGVTPLVLLVARCAVLSSRRSFVGRSFPFVWFGFALLAAAVALASWAMTSVLALSFLDPRRFAFQAVLTVALFPPIDWLFARLQRATEAWA